MKESENKKEFAKSLGYTADLFGAGSIIGLQKNVGFYQNEGPKYGYFQEETKTWLIVKPELFSEAKQFFSNTGLNITTEGRKHLGAAVGSASYKEDYVNRKVDRLD